MNGSVLGANFVYGFIAGFFSLAILGVMVITAMARAQEECETIDCGFRCKTPEKCFKPGSIIHTNKDGKCKKCGMMVMAFRKRNS